MSDTTTGPAVLATGLSKRYGEVQALDGLDIAADPGTVLGLLGPNGAGKTTTVKILTTLTRADAGRARVAGYDVGRDPAQVRRRIGVVTQKPGADPAATGRENLVLAGRIQGLGRRAAQDRAGELLAAFELADAADRPARTWSGGMARKLDVAIGIVHRPQVLFLDEPTTGLDPQARAEMWTEVERLAADGTTVLLTTHYLEEADRLADRVAIVDHGRVVASGTPEALKSGMRGDAVVVELAHDADPVGAQAAVLGTGLRGTAVDGRTLRARVDDGAQAVPLVLAALGAAGVPVAAITVSRPSLDDVYLRHTGHSLATGVPAGVAA
jgi:ABC-2 type transport system ATP-binding protein